MLTAKKIISKYWNVGILPIDPILIAVSMGLSVLATNEGVNRYDAEKLLITYNPKESFHKQRFTIAHMIGHYALKDGTSHMTNPPNFNMPSEDEKESKANQFAIELLMPENFVKALVEVQMIRSLKKLSRIFLVSTAAMGYRLRQLNYSVE